MSVLWLAPAALLALASLLGPVLIHRMARAEHRAVPFPSLRFLRVSSEAVSRRRRIDDVILLILRMTALACSIVAAAGPLLITPARERAWSSRVSRAFVVAPQAAPPSADANSARAVTAIPWSERPADALRAAVAWLERQPLSAREVVVVGDLRRGQLSDADVAVIPADVGLRFVPLPVDAATRDLRVTELVARDGADGSREWPVRVENDRTVVGAAEPVMSAAAAARLEVRAAAADLPAARAARDALLARGIVVDHAGARRLVVAWQGADVTSLEAAVYPPSHPWILAASESLPYDSVQRGDVLLVTIPDRAAMPGAALQLAAIADVVFADGRHRLEPEPLDAAAMTAWSRPPGAPTPDAQPGDQGDRRVLWALALACLAVEQVWRRRTDQGAVASAEAHVETRVA